MRELLAQGRSREAIAVGGEILGERGDPEEKALAATQRLAAYFNIGQAGTAECRETEEQARELAREVGSPTAQGHFHALAAGLSSARGSADQALAHLLDSQRYLNAEQVVTPAAELAWYDLATTQGNLGLGDSVLASLRRLGQMTGVEGAWLSPRLDAALALDHVGDTRGAIAGLEEVIQHGRLHGVGGPGASGDRGRGGLRYWDAISRAYAAARLAVLSAESDADPRRLAVVDGGAGAGSRRLAVVEGAGDAGPRALAVIEGHRRVDSLRLADDAITSALHLLIRACLAVAAHRPHEALAFLDRIGPECPLPVSELLRVRSLALTAAGDASGAVELERQSFRIQSQRMYQLQRLMLAQPPCAETGPEPAAGGEAWELSSYVREALTDPLTGLPNRRHLERRLAEFTAAGRPAALAVLDLDG
ncbi:MAG: hypothetical protein HOV83_05710, partial [Catenulispora sp.]|nr:hypothetical protein [Catenulispora sp.]